MNVSNSIAIAGGRRLVFGTLDLPLPKLDHTHFAVLLPAFDPSDRCRAESIAIPLIDAGCIEFCCMGIQAELLHDSLDDLAVESHDSLNIVTTWHTNETDAFEYFLWAAGGRSSTLLALVSRHPDLALSVQRAAGATQDS